MKTFYLFCIAVISSITINAQSQGPYHPRVMANGTLTGSMLVWANNDNGKTSDDLYADFDITPGDIGSYTDYLMTSNYDFNIPLASNITGILVEIERSDPLSLSSDYSIRLTKGGTPGDADKSTGLAFPLADTYQSYGGPSDLGTTWTAAEINSTDFGVAIAAQIAAKDIGTSGQIDDVQITVFYTLVTLPLELIAFNGQGRPDRVRLTWSTTDESNMDQFVIERSADATDFNAIGSVNCTNTNLQTDYTLDDMTPVRGKNFYRLAMKENTGEINYSKVVFVEFKPSRTTVRLNPSFFQNGGLLFLRNTTHEKLNIEFFNSSGQQNASVTTTLESITTSGLGLTKGLIYYKIMNAGGEVLGTGKLMSY